MGQSYPLVQKNLGFFSFKDGFVKLGISFETFPIFLIALDSVSEKCGIGFGIRKNLVSKKYRMQYQKILNLVSFRFLVSSHTVSQFR